MAGSRLGTLAYWRGGLSRKLWWFIVIAPFGFAAALVTLRDGLLTPEYQNVSLFHYLGWRSHWHWYVIAILAYWLVVLLFLAPANARRELRKQKERHRKVYRRLRERNPKPIVIYQGRPDPPNLTFSVKVRRVFRDRSGVIHEQDAGAHADTDFYAVTCAIKNAISAERKVGDFIDASAHIDYRSFTYDQGLPIEKGTWLGLSSGKVAIPKNETRELIIATNEQDEHFALSYETVPVDGRVSRRVSLSDFLFPADVRVKLISEVEGVPISESRFVLDRHAYITEADLILAPIDEWRLARIAEHINTGDDLFQRATVLPANLNSPDLRQVAKEIDYDFRDWIQDVELFLDRFWDADHRSKFNRQTILIRRDTEEDLRNYISEPTNNALAKRILAKLYVLYRFQHELEDEIEKTVMS